MATLEEQYTNAVEREKRLRARLDAKRAREREQERKLRTRALIIIGGEVTRLVHDDWESIDPERLRRWLDGHRASFREEVLADDSPTAREAMGRLESFRRGDGEDGR